MEKSKNMGHKDNTTEKGARSFAIVRRGTGPRTATGKERSKQNSRKHGILSKTVVLESESQDEFDSLLNGLRDYFCPIGTHEDLLVDDLACLWWRKRRFLIAERAEILAASLFVDYDEKQRQLNDAGEILERSSCGGLVRKITNPEVLQKCLKLLADLNDAIKQRGFNPERDKAVLTALYGDFEGDPREHALLNSYLMLSTAASVPNDVRELGEFLSPELYAKDFLKELSNEIERLERYKKKQASIESERMKLKSLRLDVPEPLFRYSVCIDRGIERTFNQLERAQRRRLGEPAEPRIDVNVTSS
jgi:hypothetical protein